MKGEYDLVNELGQCNWIDCVAGEVVVIGHTLNDPELVAVGTELSRMVREIKFDDDRFCLVEAMAESIETKLDSLKRGEKITLFIDEIFEGEEKHKPLDKWEYDLILCEGKYQIKMLLPQYDRYSLVDERKMKAEQAVKECFEDSSFESYRKEEQIVDFTTQVFKIYTYFDAEGKLLRRTVDHDHEGGWYRGWIDMFYFDNFEKAIEAWGKVKQACGRND